MGKVKTFAKQNWKGFLVGFLVGAGSIANAKARATNIAQNPKSVMSV